MDKWKQLLGDVGDLNHETISYVTKGNLFYTQIKQASIVQFDMQLYTNKMRVNGLEPDLDELWSLAEVAIKQKEVERSATEYHKSLHQNSAPAAAGITTVLVLIPIAPTTILNPRREKERKVKEKAKAKGKIKASSRAMELLTQFVVHLPLKESHHQEQDRGIRNKILAVLLPMVLPTPDLAETGSKANAHVAFNARTTTLHHASMKNSALAPLERNAIFSMQQLRKK